jgi:hypothetical protein
MLAICGRTGGSRQRNSVPGTENTRSV